MATIRVEVVYALPASEDTTRVFLPSNSRLMDAIVASGMLRRHPEIDLGRQKCGVFGEPRALGSVLADGDRVELYRPLRTDPKEARRRRARKKR